MIVPPKPFSFISWDECYQTQYDRYCQELWDWPKYVDSLYPPSTPFAQMPWNEQEPLFDEPDSEGSLCYAKGMVSIWALLSTEIQLEDYFLPEDPSCEWEPLEYPLFWDDLGFILYAHREDYISFPEFHAIADLLTDSTYGECEFLSSFKDELIQSCREQSIDEASGLYLVYDCDYPGPPVFGRFCSGNVVFLGSFFYGRKSHYDSEAT